MPTRSRKTRKQVMRIKKKSNRKSKKIYGSDSFAPYQIHKVTLISYDPLKTCKTLKKIFGPVVSKIHSPPDKALKKRGIKWVRFLTGGKAELHFVPPFNLEYTSLLKKMVKQQDKQDPLETELFENHIGLYVPDLTSIVINTIKSDIPYIMNKREDGLYQLYIDLIGSTDYLEVDSINFDFNKVHTKYPYFRIMGFSDNTKFVKKLIKNRKEKTITYAYIDPKHDGAPRLVEIHKNGKIKIIGRDHPGGKKWHVESIMDKNGNTKLDFSSKGGPSNMNANVNTNRIKFADGNVWKRDVEKLYNLL